MSTLIVSLIILGAVAFLSVRIYNAVSGKGVSCSCGGDEKGCSIVGCPGGSCSCNAAKKKQPSR